MGFVLFQAFNYAALAALVITRLWRKSIEATHELTVLLLGVPFAIIIELFNEFVVAGNGAYYPRSLLYFPFFRFRVAIVCSSTVYVWVLYVIARWTATAISGPGRQARFLVRPGILLVLVATNFIPEWLVHALGYMQFYHLPVDMLRVQVTIQVLKYLLYFWMMVPPVVFTELVFWHLRSRGRLHPGMSAASAGE